MILIGSGRSRLDAGVIFSETEAPARARACFPKCVFEGRATTTTAPVRYFLTIYSGTPWPEGPKTQEGRYRSRLPCNLVKLLKAELQQQRLPLDTSSQFTPRRPGQRGPRTQEGRFRWRLPHDSVKLVKAQIRRQRLPLDTSSLFTPRRPGQRGPRTQERRSRLRLPHKSVK